MTRPSTGSGDWPSSWTLEQDSSQENQDGWNLRPEHFAERHGLFVIIALGETLIVAAVQVTDGTWTTEALAVAALAVALTCGFWWTY